MSLNHPNLYTFLWTEMVSPTHSLLEVTNAFCDIQQGITLAKYQAHYIDYYSLGPKTNRPGMITYYFNHLDELERFIQYFETQAAPLLAKASQQKIHLPADFTPERHVNHSLLKKQTLADGMQKDMQYYGLTPREQECVLLPLRKGTAKGIAKSLALSPRTVEHHIARVKDKPHCKNKTELISKCYELMS